MCLFPRLIHLQPFLIPAIMIPSSLIPAFLIAAFRAAPPRNFLVLFRSICIGALFLTHGCECTHNSNLLIVKIGATNQIVLDTTMIKSSANHR